MAKSIRDIKRRIRSINGTMKITSAMELVSSAKLVKARERLIRTRPYYSTVHRNFKETCSALNKTEHPLLKEREIHSSLYIIISDDRGLAGGYNNNIARLVEDEIKKTGNRADLILIGSKAIDYFQKEKYKIVEKFTGITEEPDFKDAETISYKALDLYENNWVDEIKVAFTRFINNMHQEPTIMRILPAELPETSYTEKQLIEFEPSPGAVLDYLIPKYVAGSIYGALVEASCSEQAARTNAMGIATENAKEMIEELIITYNRARQTAITTEITEIVSGSEVLNT
jgi:F-type H+-transporting ATPase subunit gamma